MIPKESWETFKRCGFYSFNHPLPSKNGGSDEDSSSSIKFVALNTNLYYHNKLKLNLTDPCGQLSWMDEELRMAKRNENIFILSHVPPGHFERNPREPLFTIPTGQELTKRFVDIVTERSTASKITAHFYGHTHTDTFRLFMKNGDAAGVAYVAPSITPSLWLENKAYGVNPGFRMFSYESDTDTVLDYQQYYLPLDQVGYLHEKAFIDRSSRNSKRLKWRRRKREDTGQEIDASTELSADPDITTKKEEVVSDSEIERPDGDEATTVKAPSKDSESLATTIKPPQGEENQRDGEILTTLSPVSEDITTTINSSVNQDQPAEIEHVVTTAAPKAPRTPLDLLVSKWKFGYNATTALNITNLSIKQMHMAYLHMYHDPQGLTFKLFYKHNTMFHIKPENQTCADECFFAQMCTIKNMLYEDMKECMEESISVSWPATPFPTPAVETTTALSESPAVTATPATTTTTAVPPPWRRTTTTTEDYYISTPPAAVANNGDHVSHVENQPDPADVAEKEDHYGTGVLVGFLLVLCVALGIGGFMLYRRIHYRRFPAQESLLLTDTDFRYEGCSQNDLS